MKARELCDLTTEQDLVVEKHVSIFLEQASQVDAPTDLSFNSSLFKPKVAVGLVPGFLVDAVNSTNNLTTLPVGPTADELHTQALIAGYARWRAKSRSEVITPQQLYAHLCKGVDFIGNAKLLRRFLFMPVSLINQTLKLYEQPLNRGSNNIGLV
jgi:hypothetical protein